MSDTPRMQFAILAYRHAGFANIWKVGCDIERELTASNERVRLLISERDTARGYADQKWKLRQEFHDLFGTDDISEAVALVRELQARIKRLEEDLMDAKNKHAALVADVALYDDRGERIKLLEEALSLITINCEDVHHSKKHRHGWSEPCPVVELISKAKEAKL